ncbi:MAG: hypothetical protein M0R20_04345 [Candidatus Omnitrophica bacterium]|jgi:hypothetical protein|nr:hypothetical protein [Candidatus Omnitrophota bacterium]
MRIAIIGILIFSCMAFVCSAEEVQMPPNIGPQIRQVTGDSTVCLDATRYPKFYSYQSDNPTCGEYLKTEYDAQSVTGNQSSKGFSLAPLWLKSKYSGTKDKKPPLSVNPGYQEIPGLNINYRPEEAYRKTANLLVTWTVRVEAYKHCGANNNRCASTSTAEYCDGDAYKLWPDLCSVWHGTSNQSFPGGEVKTALFVNGVQKGTESIMTIPDGGVTSSYQPNDPTHTGSFLISADSFPEKVLPESIDISVKWYNDTSMQIKSPAKMRNLIVTVVPRERITE